MEQLNMFSLDKDVTSDYSALTNERTKPKAAHCFFEQSGTFKNEFIKLGIPAYDYDIQNEFGQTDYVIDLFDEIEKAYDDKPSIFDSISEDDLIFAFFPCTRFEDQIMLGFRGQNAGMNKWTMQRKLNYSMQLHEELNLLYRMISKLVIVCINKQLKMIIENPYSAQHYLRQYWCLKPTLIDKDRTLNGDWYKKSTQYFFIGCKPHNNLIFEPIEYVERKSLKWDVRNQTARSMIHPQYANRFIRQYIL